MICWHEKYLVDEEGNPRAVVPPLAECEQILGALEELEEIRAYDEAERDRSESIVPCTP
jgi:hypothetical protein